MASVNSASGGTGPKASKMVIMVNSSDPTAIKDLQTKMEAKGLFLESSEPTGDKVRLTFLISKEAKEEIRRSAASSPTLASEKNAATVQSPPLPSDQKMAMAQDSVPPSPAETPLQVSAEKNAKDGRSSAMHNFDSPTRPRTKLEERLFRDVPGAGVQDTPARHGEEARRSMSPTVDRSVDGRSPTGNWEEMYHAELKKVVTLKMTLAELETRWNEKREVCEKLMTELSSMERQNKGYASRILELEKERADRSMIESSTDSEELAITKSKLREIQDQNLQLAVLLESSREQELRMTSKADNAERQLRESVIREETTSVAMAMAKQIFTETEAKLHSDLENMRAHIEKLQAQLDGALTASQKNDVKDAMESHLRDCKKEIAALHDEREHLTRDLKAALAEKEAAEKVVGILRADLDILSKPFLLNRDDITPTEFKAALNCYRANEVSLRRQLQQALKKYDDALRDFEFDKNMLVLETEKGRSEISLLQQQIDRMHRVANDFGLPSENEQNSVEYWWQKHAAAIHEIEQKESEIEAILTKERQAGEMRENQVRADREKMQTEINELKESIHTLQAQLADATVTRTINDAELQVHQAITGDKKYKMMEEEVVRLNERVASLTREHKEANTTQSNLSDIIETTKAALEAAEKKVQDQATELEQLRKASSEEEVFFVRQENLILKEKCEKMEKSFENHEEDNKERNRLIAELRTKVKQRDADLKKLKEKLVEAEGSNTSAEMKKHLQAMEQVKKAAKEVGTTPSSPSTSNAKIAKALQKENDRLREDLMLIREKNKEMDEELQKVKTEKTFSNGEGGGEINVVLMAYELASLRRERDNALYLLRRASAKAGGRVLVQGLAEQWAQWRMEMADSISKKKISELQQVVATSLPQIPGQTTSRSPRSKDPQSPGRRKFAATMPMEPSDQDFERSPAYPSALQQADSYLVKMAMKPRPVDAPSPLYLGGNKRKAVPRVDSESQTNLDSAGSAGSRNPPSRGRPSLRSTEPYFAEQ